MGKISPHDHPFKPDPKDVACKVCGCLEGTHGKEKSMTQELSDEGLHELAGNIAEFHLKSDCSCEWERQCRVCGLSWGILSALKQVRRETARPLVEALEKVLKFEASCGENDISDEDRDFAKQALTAHRALEGR